MAKDIERMSLAELDALISTLKRCVTRRVPGASRN